MIKVKMLSVPNYQLVHKSDINNYPVSSLIDKFLKQIKFS